MVSDGPGPALIPPHQYQIQVLNTDEMSFSETSAPSSPAGPGVAPSPYPMPVVRELHPGLMKEWLKMEVCRYIAIGQVPPSFLLSSCIQHCLHKNSCKTSDSAVKLPNCNTSSTEAIIFHPKNIRYKLQCLVDFEHEVRLMEGQKKFQVQRVENFRYGVVVAVANLYDRSMVVQDIVAFYPNFIFLLNLEAPQGQPEAPVTLYAYVCEPDYNWILHATSHLRVMTKNAFQALRDGSESDNTKKRRRTDDEEDEQILPSSKRVAVGEEWDLQLQALFDDTIAVVEIDPNACI